jgi:hypothetical protein
MYYAVLLSGLTIPRSKYCTGKVVSLAGTGANLNLVSLGSYLIASSSLLVAQTVAHNVGHSSLWFLAHSKIC